MVTRCYAIHLFELERYSVDNHGLSLGNYLHTYTVLNYLHAQLDLISVCVSAATIGILHTIPCILSRLEYDLLHSVKLHENQLDDGLSPDSVVPLFSFSLIPTPVEPLASNDQIMRLNILLTTGAIISSVFALPTSSQTLSQRARNEKGTEGDDQHDLLDRLVNPAWALSAAAAGYLGYRGLRYLLSPEGQRAKQNWIRYLEEWNRRLEENAEQSRQRRKEFLQERRLLTLSNLHGYLRRTGDDITVQAPNGQEVQLTWTEKVHLTDCIRIVVCSEFARSSGRSIYTPSITDEHLEIPKGRQSK